MSDRPRILLSSPHMSGREAAYVAEAFDTNWVAPLGPLVDRFEATFAAYVGMSGAAALASGTAALHLALRLAGVGPGDRVVVSDLTFVASVSPVTFLGAEPVFVDAERATWNMDSALLDQALGALAAEGRPAKAVVVTHLYGLLADMDAIAPICARHGAILVEDAAEALGAIHGGRHAGTMGAFGIYSFNGNKIITTGGGGMLVARDPDMLPRARYLASQARVPAPHYEHVEIGYNYRLSNVLAGVGLGQMEVLEERVARRRDHFRFYGEALGALPGVEVMPSPPFGRNTHWLSCLLVDPVRARCDRDALLRALDAAGVEARPVWKPMHAQPVFGGARVFDRGVGADLFARGLCLPSGSNLSDEDRARVADAVRRALR